MNDKSIVLGYAPRCLEESTEADDKVLKLGLLMVVTEAL